MGHLNGILGRGEFEQKISKKSNARRVARGGMLKLRFDRYITFTIHCSQLSVERTVERSEEWDSRLYLTAVRPKRPNKERGKRSTLFYFEEKGKK